MQINTKIKDPKSSCSQDQGLPRPGGEGKFSSYFYLARMSFPTSHSTERKLRPTEESDLPEVMQEDTGKVHGQPGLHSGTFSPAFPAIQPQAWGLEPSFKGGMRAASGQHKVDWTKLCKEVQPNHSV